MFFRSGIDFVLYVYIVVILSVAYDYRSVCAFETHDRSRGGISVNSHGLDPAFI